MSNRKEKTKDAPGTNHINAMLAAQGPTVAMWYPSAEAADAVRQAIEANAVRPGLVRKKTLLRYIARLDGRAPHAATLDGYCVRTFGHPFRGPG
jgi:hypothetical protein